MSPNEQELLSTLAQSAYINLAQVIMIITGYGIVLGTCIVLVLVRHGPHFAIITRGLILCLVVNFVCFTWLTVYVGGICLIQVKYTFVKALPGGLVNQVQLTTKQAMAWQFMPWWAATINILLSDGIVVWRAWILLQHDNIRRLALGCLMVANTAVNIADCIWENVNLEVEIATNTSTLDWVSNMLSLLVNFCATSLIALKASIEVSLLLQMYGTATSLNFLEAMNTITNIFGIVSYYKKDPIEHEVNRAPDLLSDTVIWKGEELKVWNSYIPKGLHESRTSHTCDLTCRYLTCGSRYLDLRVTKPADTHDSYPEFICTEEAQITLDL
ncbi:hypothetical protein EV361DRAFT_867253 [Lentinula raphanica]|nr:hypothetical protein EV361DRAFT_867253 [Lentinula raphanica]